MMDAVGNFLKTKHDLTTETKSGLRPCLVTKFKIQIFFPAPAWRLKSRRNKKRIATAVCKWRDESNEPN